MNASTTAGPTGAQVYDQPTAGEDAHTILVNRVSWGAIFAGVVVALVVQVLLTMLGVGIGVATLDPGAGDNPAVSTFSVVTGIWYVLSGIIAAFAGGYIAARMSGKTVATTGALHGLTTWAFTTLLVLYLLSTAVGGIVGGAFNGITSAVGGLGQTVAQTAAPIIAEANPLDAIENQVRASGNDPEALNAAATNAIRALVTGDEAGADEARGQAAQALATARGIPLDQAQQQVAQMEEQYHQTVDQAQRDGDRDRRHRRLGRVHRRPAGLRGAGPRCGCRMAGWPIRCRSSGLRRSHDPDPPQLGVTLRTWTGTPTCRSSDHPRTRRRRLR